MVIHTAMVEDNDLNKSYTLPIPPKEAFCDHSQMKECHPGCGHFSCPCGISWDEGSEGNYGS